MAERRASASGGSGKHLAGEELGPGTLSGPLHQVQPVLPDRDPADGNLFLSPKVLQVWALGPHDWAGSAAIRKFFL